MKKAYSLIIIIGFLFGIISNVSGQEENRHYTVSEKVVIGKKYKGKISEAAIARIDAKMEEIKALIKKTSIDNDTLDLRLNYIKDVNNLKSLQMFPSFHSDPKTDVNTLALLEILKKYPYIDVMVTVTTGDQESADKLANENAMTLYNGGLEKERMRVNGLVGKPKVKGFILIFEPYIQLVPSREMIYKAITGTL